MSIERERMTKVEILIEREGKRERERMTKVEILIEREGNREREREGNRESDNRILQTIDILA